MSQKSHLHIAVYSQIANPAPKDIVIVNRNAGLISFLSLDRIQHSFYIVLPPYEYLYA